MPGGRDGRRVASSWSRARHLLRYGAAGAHWACVRHTTEQDEGPYSLRILQGYGPFCFSRLLNESGGLIFLGQFTEQRAVLVRMFLLQDLQHEASTLGEDRRSIFKCRCRATEKASW